MTASAVCLRQVDGVSKGFIQNGFERVQTSKEVMAAMRQRTGKCQRCVRESCEYLGDINEFRTQSQLWKGVYKSSPALANLSGHQPVAHSTGSRKPAYFLAKSQKD